MSLFLYNVEDLSRNQWLQEVPEQLAVSITPQKVPLKVHKAKNYCRGSKNFISFSQIIYGCKRTHITEQLVI